MEFDYSFVNNPARVAVYDDLLSSPRIIDIEPDGTREFINALASTIYSHSQAAGGEIPFSIILQVAENFIHSRFTEVVVSVFDHGNTIRFADQGPGIADKEKAQQPGYSSATSPMKNYIHGVGSGLPIVREYMETKNGTIQIEDNIGTGAVVTISLDAKNRQDTGNADPAAAMSEAAFPVAARSGRGSRAVSTDRSVDLLTAGLSKRAFSILSLFALEEVWGVTDISKELELPPSSTFSELNKLEEAGIITKLGKKRALTDFGAKVVEDLHRAL